MEFLKKIVMEKKKKIMINLSSSPVSLVLSLIVSIILQALYDIRIFQGESKLGSDPLLFPPLFSILSACVHQSLDIDPPDIQEVL